MLETLLAYYFLGLVVLFVHPAIRSILMGPIYGESEPTSAGDILVFIVGLIVGATLWPVVLGVRAFRQDPDEDAIDEIHRLLADGNLVTPLSDPVLLIYYRLITKRLTEVARERKERIDPAQRRRIGARMVAVWAEVFEQGLALGMPFIIKSAMDVYRKKGIRDLEAYIVNELTGMQRN